MATGSTGRWFPRGRYGYRDATMILIAFRHGLWPAEVCALRWDMIDLGHGLLHVRNRKFETAQS